MARIAVSLPIETERRIVAEAERHGHEVVATTTGAEELTHEVSTATAAIVLSAARYLSPELLAACDVAGVRVVALVADDAGRRHAASVGLFETADATAPWSAIEKLLGAPAAPAASSAVGRGNVLAVWGPAGAPGRTSVAITLAAEIAALGHAVALADVDTHAAAVAPTIGLSDEAPGFAAACRLAGSDSLTRQELERIAQRYESPAGGFWGLTGIGRPNRWPELTRERVRGSVAACRAWVDVTVLDTAAEFDDVERHAATIAALEEADRVVAVGSADPVGLSRFLRGHAELGEVVGGRDLAVVMNRVRASALGMNPATQVTQALARFGGIEAAALVPYDRAAFDAAVLSGRALPDVAPRSPARVALRDLAATLAPPPPTRRRRKR